MLILNTAGDTIQAEASAVSSLTVSCYGIETTSGTDVYKLLGQTQLTGSGTQDTIYTVPASSTTICSVIIIANTSATLRTLKLWHVPNGESVGDGYLIFGTVDVKANTTVVWNRGNIQSIPDMDLSGDDHNSLTGLQGGTATEYYHMTSEAYARKLLGDYVAEYGSLTVER